MRIWREYSKNSPSIGTITIVSLSLAIFLSTGCSKKETSLQGERTQEIAGKSNGTLTIGLIPEHNIFMQLERYQPLAGYLSKKTGTKVNLKILSRYGNIIDNFLLNNLDGAFFGSFTYALAHSRVGVEVLARPENLEGVSTYYGLLFVRKDSGIKKIGDMRGKSFAFVDKATTAGYLLPLHFFTKSGIRGFRTYLKETYFTGTHEDAVYDVLNKKADIGAAKNTVFYRLARKDSRILSELEILEKSPPVPENALAVRSDIGDDVKTLLKETLLTMHTEREGLKLLKDFGALRFVETTDEDYTVVFQYAKEAGLNLSTYDYIND